jgi:endo-1,4-beta-xylanase
MINFDSDMSGAGHNKVHFIFYVAARPYLLVLLMSLAMVSCQDTTVLGPPDIKDPYYTQGSLAHIADFPIGTAYEVRLNISDPAYARIVDSQFNSLTAENSMKLYDIWPQGPGSDLDFSRADGLLEYAISHHKRLHGHTLAWHYNETILSWLRDYAGTPAEFENVYKAYVDTVVGRYRGKLSGWDVVNEAVADVTPMLRNDVYKRLLGNNYVYKLFRWAGDADPETDLFYNDYGLELSPPKLDMVLKICDDARRQGARIDGIGFQSHILFPELVSYRMYYDAFKKVADKGYKIHISELDIPINGPLGLMSSPTPEALEKQYEYYRVIVKAYRAAVPRHLQYGITVWGATDKHSWYSQVPYWINNKTDWPCLYDSLLQPKPAYYGFQEGLR